MAEGKKGRKVGRNKARCAAYRAAQRQEVNKAKKLIRFLRRPHNAKAADAWVSLEKLGSVLFAAQKREVGYAAFMETRPK